MSTQIVPRQPLAIAHRGDSANFPENTAAAFSAALKHRIAGIELDLRLTGDGRVVVCHDADLRRFGGSAQRLSTRRSADLAAEDIGSWFGADFSDQRLVTLERLLRDYGRRTMLLLELKPVGGRRGAAPNRSLCRAVVAAVRRARAVERVLVLCFDQRQLDHVHRLEPGLRCVRNRERLPRDPGRFTTLHPWLHGLCVDQRHLATAAATVAACHARGLKVFTYTCNTAAEVARARTAGVDAILADDPGLLVRTLAGSR